jgi:hypothetical protein
MRIRILCGSYVPSSPFIDGGCTCDWSELLDPARALRCPQCGQECPEEVVEAAHEMLRTRSVFAVGCPHRSFTFSRLTREPYFNAAGPVRESS